MGTRSLTRVNTADGKQLLNMYRQFDGYPSGHGQELFDMIKNTKILNGYSSHTAPDYANGAGCLAAQIVANFKKDIGGFYLYPVDATDCGQDYEYILTIKEVDWDSSDKFGDISIKVVSYGRTEFEGNVSGFGKYCQEPESDED